MLNKEEIIKAKDDLIFFNEGDYITREMDRSADVLEDYIEQLEQENKQLKISYKLMENEAMKDGLEERKKLNKIIDEMAKQLEKFLNIPNRDDCFIPREYSDINDCVKKASCTDCIKQYFEKKVEGDANGKKQ